MKDTLSKILAISGMVLLSAGQYSVAISSDIAVPSASNREDAIKQAMDELERQRAEMEKIDQEKREMLLALEQRRIQFEQSRAEFKKKMDEIEQIMQLINDGKQQDEMHVQKIRQLTADRQKRREELIRQKKAERAKKQDEIQEEIQRIEAVLKETDKKRNKKPRARGTDSKSMTARKHNATSSS